MEEFIGQKFNKLTIISNKFTCNKKTYVNAICECGNVKKYRLDGIKSGHAKSCGCIALLWAKNLAKQVLTTHNMSRSSEYIIYADIKKRCYNNKYKDFENYGGRGIKVCDRWLKGFENFYKDMGDRPTLNHSIDRIDVNGNYEPLNCRWATQKEQCNNKRNNKKVILNGVEIKLNEYCDKNNLNYQIISSRINSGWSVEKSFLEPMNNHYTKILLNGEQVVLKDECAKRNLPLSIIKQRLFRDKWSVEKSFNYPILHTRKKINL